MKGFNLITNWIGMLFRFFGFFFLVTACGQRDVLVDNRWILIGGTIKNYKIEFNTIDQINFTDQNGKIIRSLNFGKDQTIILPGINSSSIQAKWTLEGDLIRFSIDSM